MSKKVLIIAVVLFVMSAALLSTSLALFVNNQNDVPSQDTQGTEYGNEVKPNENVTDNISTSNASTESGHIHTVVIDEFVMSTCTETGLTEGSHCSVCGEIIVPQNVVSMIDHYPMPIEAIEPSCTSPGLTEGSYCLHCNFTLVEQEEIPAAGHCIVSIEYLAPTCSLGGHTEGSYCSVCNEIISKTELLPAKGHTVVVDKGINATCITLGLTDGSHCSVCGEIIKKQTSIDFTDHHYITKNSVTYCEYCFDVLPVSPSFDDFTDYTLISIGDFPWHLYSNDGKVYLGKLVTNKYDLDSIWNPYGDYGSKYSPTSIWNPYSRYGSDLGLNSAFNDHTLHPPIIVTNSGKLVGYLTSNESKLRGYTITELERILKKANQ